MSNHVDRFLLNWAADEPDRTAVAAPGRRYSYGDLTEAVAAYALALEELGLGRGDRLVVVIEPCFEAVALLCACSRLGVIWTPVSPENPAARIAAVVSTVSAQALVGTAATEELVRSSAPDPDFPTGICSEQQLAWRLPPGRRAPAPREKKPVLEIDPAYIVFTSGSTGEPKGIVMPHRSVCSFFDVLVEFCGLTRDAVVGTMAPVQFDFWLLDIALALGSGAALAYVPRPSFYQPKRMAGHMKALGVTQMHGVPSIWPTLMRHAEAELKQVETLQTILFGGEAFPVPALRRLQDMLPHLRMINAYGPSECLACSFKEIPNPIPADVERIPFGPGFRGVELISVDEDGREILTPHTPGELYIRGGNLFSGYWDNEEATRNAMAPRPGAPETGEQVYKSGDIVYFDEAGDYYFVERRDSQVKIMGHRIELAEIAAALRSFPGAGDAVVFQAGGEADGSASPSLVACVTTVSGADIAPHEIRSWCLRKLPRHMTPVHIETREEFPLTANGKIDVARIKREWADKRGDTPYS